MGKEDFIKWLENSTELAPYTINRYAGAIDTLSTELENYGLNEDNLFSGTDKKVIESILINPVFKEKNKKGNNMYSAALNHFIGYIEYCNNNKYTIIDDGNDNVVIDPTLLT